MENQGLSQQLSPNNGIDNSYFPTYNHYRARRTSLEIPHEEEEMSLDGDSTFFNYHNRDNYNNTNITAETIYKSLLQRKPGGSVYSYSAASSARAKIQRSQNVRKPDRVEVPKDGNLSGLSCRDICSVLSCMNFNPSIIARIKNHRINGKSFAKLTDDDLRDLGIYNPVIQHFRNKSKRKHGIFML
ncbi:unnamed protein product [Acanthosepion pharaonis]|uniref:SAM domain-containing protein n=1 Tax=Acanthosepion pharaonis TaxID=158019 RepID=A0A812BEB2_ACAPH|nr:unnamed protein product [Sepia pharaonis]